MRIKTIDFGKRVEAIVHIWLTRWSFVSITRAKFLCSLTRELILYNPAYLVTCVCELLNKLLLNGVCKVYYLYNISENEEALLSYPKVVIEKETFPANHGCFP